MPRTDPQRHAHIKLDVAWKSRPRAVGVSGPRLPGRGLAKQSGGQFHLLPQLPARRRDGTGVLAPRPTPPRPHAAQRNVAPGTSPPPPPPFPRTSSPPQPPAPLADARAHDLRVGVVGQDRGSQVRGYSVRVLAAVDAYEEGLRARAARRRDRLLHHCQAARRQAAPSAAPVFMGFPAAALAWKPRKLSLRTSYKFRSLPSDRIWKGMYLSSGPSCSPLCSGAGSGGGLRMPASARNMASGEYILAQELPASDSTIRKCVWTGSAGLHEVWCSERHDPAHMPPGIDRCRDLAAPVGPGPQGMHADPGSSFHRLHTRAPCAFL